jgi:trimethylamine-N-oxide reductase (cytochrome c)
METLITHELYWTPWAKISDIVLPVTSTLENNDIGLSYEYNLRYIWAMKQVIKPLYGAKSDYWIYSQLADRLGFKEQFTLGRSTMDWIRWSYSSAKLDVPFEEFWEKGYLFFEKPEKDKKFVYMEEYIDSPEKKPLFTPSGKIEIYSEKVASFGYSDCCGYPMWKEPKEYLGSEIAKKHRFHLLSLHPKHRLHSQMDNLTVKDEYKVNNREPAVFNPDDAEKMGISYGDTVEIYNDRGAIVCSAVISKDVMPSVVRVDEGAWYAPEVPGKIGTRCLSGNPNVLTSDRPTSRLAQACTAHSCLVSVKKLPEGAKRNTAYDVPKIIKSSM